MCEKCLLVSRYVVLEKREARHDIRMYGCASLDAAVCRVTCTYSRALRPNAWHQYQYCSDRERESCFNLQHHGIIMAFLFTHWRHFLKKNTREKKRKMKTNTGHCYDLETKRFQLIYIIQSMQTSVTIDSPTLQ